MKNTAVTIIVPVYNVEQYLDRCVESIVNQTYRNLEIILVDDGSPDNCPAMCDEWAKKDSRIKVIHKENGGQAEARNYGLNIATGDYVAFVDSDDYISLDMYNDLLSVSVKTGSDVVGCSYTDFDNYNPPAFYRAELNSFIRMSKKEAILDLIKENHFQSTVWNLLVKSEIAKEVLFDVGKIHEDILWPFRVFLKSNSFAYTTSKYYAYYQRQGSTMNSVYSTKRFDALDALESRAEIVKKEYPEYLHIATRAYMGACMYHYQMLCRQAKSDEYERYKSALHTRFCKGDFDALFDGLSFKYKVWYSMFRAFPNVTCKIRNRLKIGL